jgi:predicted dehydrogenase
MPKLRVAFVGAGKRMRSLYLPVLRKLSDRYETVGITTRNRATGEAAGAELSMPWYPDFATLASDLKPDLAVICVPGKHNVAAADKVLALRVPFLMETPLSPSLGEARAFVGRWKASGVHGGITEQKAFLPMEQFKRQLIRSGAFGRILVAQNDFRSLDYHAIAQLRRYLADGEEMRTAHSHRLKHDVFPVRKEDGSGSAAAALVREEWDISSIRFGDGSLLVHHFTSQYKTLAYRTFQSLRIYGDKGTMVNDAIAWLDAHGRVVETTVAVQAAPDGSGSIDGLSVRLPDGELSSWRNPHPGLGFNEDQVGLALHFERMREAIGGRGSPLYDPFQGLQDIEAIAAIRISGLRHGRPIAFPVRPLLHKAAWLAWPGNWRTALEKVSARSTAGRT